MGSLMVGGGCRLEGSFNVLTLHHFKAAAVSQLSVKPLSCGRRLASPGVFHAPSARVHNKCTFVHLVHSNRRATLPIQWLEPSIISYRTDVFRWPLLNQGICFLLVHARPWIG